MKLESAGIVTFIFPHFTEAFESFAGTRARERFISPAVIAIFACGLLFVFLLFMSFMCTIGANAPQAIKCYRCNVRYEIEKTGLSGMELLDTYKMASEILKLHPEAVKDMDEGFLKKLSSNS